MNSSFSQGDEPPIELRSSGSTPPRTPNTTEKAEVNLTDYRTRIVLELMQTEHSYVSKLKLILDIAFAPLREGKILPQKTIEQIFSNLEDIVTINQSMLEALQDRFQSWHEGQRIGDVIMGMSSIMKVAYAKYTEQHAQALTVLDEAARSSQLFSAFLEELHRRPEMEALPLQSYLILVWINHSFLFLIHLGSFSWILALSANPSIRASVERPSKAYSRRTS